MVLYFHVGQEKWSSKALTAFFSLSVSFCEPVCGLSADWEPLHSTRDDTAWAIATSYIDNPRTGEDKFC